MFDVIVDILCRTPHTHSTPSKFIPFLHSFLTNKHLKSDKIIVLFVDFFQQKSCKATNRYMVYSEWMSECKYRRSDKIKYKECNIYSSTLPRRHGNSWISFFIRSTIILLIVLTSGLRLPVYVLCYILYILLCLINKYRHTCVCVCVCCNANPD